MNVSRNHLLHRLLGKREPAAPFLRLSSGETVTYGQFAELVAGRAHALVESGFQEGDRVVMMAAKRPEALVLYLAVVAAGGVFVPLNEGYTSAELDYFLGDSAPFLVACDGSTADRAVAAAGKRNLPTIRLEDATAESPAGWIAATRGEHDLAALLYTSGTTGRSKGAMLTHGNLASNAAALVEAWRFSSHDVLIHALPIFHTHGLFVATNVSLMAGASMIFLPRFDLDAVLAAFDGATVLMGVPTFYTRLAADDRCTRDKTAHMRLFVSGSAPLLEETHRAFFARTGHAILERYGMTETNMITSNPYDGERRPGTVGQPLPGVSLRIAQPTGDGIGGIEIRGPNVTPGYWRNPEKTAETFTDDGWFITGDLATVSQDGYVSIVGREKDLVISGGYNIYPKEIEIEIDGLSGVVESAVFGLAHPDLGEAVSAAVVVENGASIDERQIVASLSGRLARYKQPRFVAIVDALPRNAMGKVQKAELRRIYADTFSKAKVR